ncbi:MAG TPA: hypothetical protein VK206_24160 [Anaerolineales bacterium]|nr:hypothetical protein [Anaerolineales bacterium]HLO33464.1 hypothetical protein [Anaerolineales bacterium]
MKKAAAIFSISMGLMMFGTWSFLFLFYGYPQAKTLPIETGYLLVAECLTSAALVLGGYGVLSYRKWAMPLLLIALGELIYCTIRYAGELGQSGSLAGLTFFTIVGAFGIVFSVYLVTSISGQKPIS